MELKIDDSIMKLKINNHITKTNSEIEKLLLQFMEEWNFTKEELLESGSVEFNSEGIIIKYGEAKIITILKDSKLEYDIVKGVYVISTTIIRHF